MDFRVNARGVPRRSSLRERPVFKAALAGLLQSSYDGEVVCLVRADDDDTAKERIRRSLARFNCERFSTDRFQTTSALPSNVRVLRGDLLSDEWHDSPHLDCAKHVLHLAASTSFGNGRAIRTTNVAGAISVAQAMRGRNLERFGRRSGSAAVYRLHAGP